MDAPRPPPEGSSPRGPEAVTAVAVETASRAAPAPMDERGGSGERAPADGGDRAEAEERAADDGGDRADSAGNASEARGDGGALRQQEAGRGEDASGRARRRLPVPLRMRGRDEVRAESGGEEPGVRGEGESEGESEEDGGEREAAGEEDEQGEQREQSSEEDEEPSPAAMLDVFRSIPTQMDYKGQKLAEQIFQGIILVSAVIGFIFGYVTEQFGWTVYIVMAGFALSCLLTLPPWPMYRRNPLKWLPVQESGTEDKKPADRKPKRHSKS
ncbi:signal peptidase complex subunit 1 [Phasianus colchicus]|uniref:signal peptidase complex subunit 1 n=1 Tax=Phasianus colchicus TaxID=9054 RepID=UPI00129EB4B0|nr:signal peptidase complex subunit 1 [Phasianus colchicus]